MSEETEGVPVTIPNVNIELLHKQRATLLDLRDNRVGAAASVTIDHLDGILNLLDCVIDTAGGYGHLWTNGKKEAPSSEDHTN